MSLIRADYLKFLKGQNTRNKDAQAVICNAEYFQDLLMYKEAVDHAIDQIMYEITLERKNEVGEISLAQVVSNFNLDLNEILALDPEHI